MNDVPVSVIADAICATYGASDALYAGREEVQEAFEDEVLWQGEVLVFDIHGHPSASRCYAWEVEGQVTTVIAEGPVNSPQSAVRAAITSGGPEAA